jgi:hypothetical protein
MTGTELVPSEGTSGGAVAVFNPNNPFLVQGSRDSSDLNVFLQFSGKTGGFTFGQKKEEMELGTRFAVMMNEYCRGWICWKEEEKIDEKMYRVVDRLPPSEDELPDHGPYEEYDDGSTDGWSAQASILLRAVDDGVGTQYLFNTSSNSGIRALGDLAKSYGKVFHLKVDENGHPLVPVVEIDQDSFMSKSKKIGKIYTPVFNIVDWVSAESLQAGIDSQSAGENPEDYEGEDSGVDASSEDVDDKKKKKKNKKKKGEAERSRRKF